jgi:hypothetical protein
MMEKILASARRIDHLHMSLCKINMKVTTCVFSPFPDHGAQLVLAERTSREKKCQLTDKIALFSSRELSRILRYSSVRELIAVISAIPRESLIVLQYLKSGILFKKTGKIGLSYDSCPLPAAEDAVSEV